MSTTSLPAGWSMKESKSQPGKFYFFNSASGETSWEPPTNTTSSVGRVRASHILRKHRGSRRPASWRCDNITQSKEDSISQITEFIHLLEEERNSHGPQAMIDLFARIAKKESDCGSAQKGGDLDFFERGQMQKPFEDATFALEVGSLSGLVDTDSGIHVILRTA